MALSKSKKKELVNEYKKRISEAKAFFVLQPKGVTPNEASELKIQLFEKDSTFSVVKNTLFRIALKEAEVDIEIADGEHAIVFSQDDFPEVAKIVDEFLASDEKGTFKSGFVEGQIISSEQFTNLSSLPSREVLLAQILATMQAPISGFVRVLNGNLYEFVNVVNAIKDQKHES